MIIPYDTRFYNVIHTHYTSGKKVLLKNNHTCLVFKVGIKASKLEIKNVLYKIFPFSAIKVRTVIIKQLIKSKQKTRYKMLKKAYITLIPKTI